MLKTVWAVVREGKIELLENATLPEGSRVLVTLMPDEDEQQFWLEASASSLTEWDNTEDDIYAELLQK